MTARNLDRERFDLMVELRDIGDHIADITNNAEAQALFDRLARTRDKIDDLLRLAIHQEEA